MHSLLCKLVGPDLQRFIHVYLEVSQAMLLKTRMAAKLELAAHTPINQGAYIYIEMRTLKLQVIIITKVIYRDPRSPRKITVTL